MTTKPLLTAENVCVDYGRLRVVHDVGFSVAERGSLGIVGESGAGKSSLLRVLAGLVKPAGGRLLWRGQNITSASPANRRRIGARIGLVFQDPYASLNPRLPIWAIVTEGLVLQGQRDRAALKRAAGEMLGKVGLDADRLTARPSSLSGGQRQRVALARALIGSPDLLLLDEPTSALDVTVQAQVLGLLRDLRETLGLALVTISHDLHVVRGLCDDVLILRAGKVVESGGCAAVFGAPRETYTRELIQAAPRLEIAP